MDENFNKIIAYIKNSLTQGVSEDAVRQALQQQGWDMATVDNAFRQAKGGGVSAALSGVAMRQSTEGPILAGPTFNVNSGQPAPVGSNTGNIGTESVQPVKYKLFSAVADTLRAIKINGLAYFLSVVISYGLATGASLLITLIIIAVILGGSGLEPSNIPTRFGGIMLIFIPLALLVSSFTQAILMTMPSLVVHDGAEGKKSDFGVVFKTGVKRVWRVMVATALMSLVLMIPIVTMIILFFGLSFSGELGRSTGAAIASPVLFIVALVVMVILMTRFALVPYVALFEPELPITKTLGRSNKLLVKGGQWFIVKGMGLMLGIAFVLALLTGGELTGGSLDNNWVLNIVLFFMTLVASGVMVMLYRNRRTVKG